MGFIRTFSVGMLEVLPPAESAWNRLVVLRSAPGAGKTSILRLLTPESLTAIVGIDNPEDAIKALRVALEELEVIHKGSLRVLGVMVNVGKDYRSLIDLGPKGAGNHKVFFKLLDARIIARAIEAVALANDLRFPDDAKRIRFVPRSGSGGESAKEALSQIGASTFDDSLHSIDSDGYYADALLRVVRTKERSVLTLLDSLLPVEWESEVGHSRLYSLPFLGNCDIEVDGHTVAYRPVVLFDDVHDLEEEQREALYGQLLDRTNNLGRWIAERKEAVPDHELLTGSTNGRDYQLVALEDELSAGSKGGHSPRLERILGGIANSRAQLHLASLGVHEQFTSLLRSAEEIEPIRKLEVFNSVIADVRALVDANPQYRSWMAAAEDRQVGLDRLEAAYDWRELQILIERDIKRSPPALFDYELESEQATRMASSGTKSAARLFLANEHTLPYYVGCDVLADLSSRNVEQYLSLGGDMFELMMSAVTQRRRTGAYLSTAEQDQRVRRSSKLLWEAVVRRVAHGPDVLALLHTIADNSRTETFRATAPYAPGVTGTAIALHERSFLFEIKSDSVTYARYERLSRALASAVANNLLEMSPEATSAKGQKWSVFYLNRLLCPHFDLPLQRGGFREQPIAKLSQKLDLARRVSADRPAPDPTTPLNSLEGWPR
ncbi:ORC-CDC6 family AAA ATPase [Pseudarthrobacter sp. MDT1-22]